MKKVAVVLLVLLVIALAIPLGIGMAMGMAPCPDCATLTHSGPLGSCLAILAGFSLVAILFLARGREAEWLASSLLLVFRVERPPQTS